MGGGKCLTVKPLRKSISDQAIVRVGVILQARFERSPLKPWKVTTQEAGVRTFIVLLRTFIVLLRTFIVLLRTFIVQLRTFIVLLRTFIVQLRTFIVT